MYVCMRASMYAKRTYVCKKKASGMCSPSSFLAGGCFLTLSSLAFCLPLLSGPVLLLSGLFPCRILQATRWRLIEVSEGTSDSDNEDNAKDSEAFPPHMKTASPGSPSYSSHTTKEGHTSRWMIPPYLYHRQERLPSLLSACGLPRETSPSLIVSSSSPFHPPRQTSPTTTGMKRILDASALQQNRDTSTIEEESSSSFLPSKPSYRQSLLEQGMTVLRKDG